MKINYVEYKHSYCNKLAPKLRAIYFRAVIEKKPANYVRTMILNITNDAKWTEKDAEFRDNIINMTDAQEMSRYCNNAVNKAKQTFVEVDEYGELVGE